MYPNATVRGNGGSGDDWKTRLPQGFDQSKIPSGANGVVKDGDIYIFTKDGVALQNGKYNADGSVFTGGNPGGASQTGSGSQTGGATQTGSAEDITAEMSRRLMQGSGTGGGTAGSVFGSGYTSTSGYDLSTSFSSAGFDVDPNRLMQSASMMYSLTNLAGSLPFGLGGLFSQGALASVMQSFMNAVSFNFDFSKYNFAASTTTTTTTTSDTEGTGTADVPKGYAATDHSGVYSKDGKYYKYDDNHELVECNADGTPKASTTTTTTTTTTSGDGTTTRGRSTSGSGATGRGNGATGGSGSGSTAVPAGYTKTSVDGVFKKDNKYYQYAADGKTLVECTRDGKKCLVSGTKVTETEQKKQAHLDKNKGIFDSHFSAGLSTENLTTIAHAGWTKELIAEVIDNSSGKYDVKTEGNTMIITSKDGKTKKVLKFDNNGRLVQFQHGADSSQGYVSISYHSNGNVKSSYAVVSGKKTVTTEYAPNGNKSKVTTRTGGYVNGNFRWKTTSVTDYHVTYGSENGKLKARPNFEVPAFSAATTGYSKSGGVETVKTKDSSFMKCSNKKGVQTALKLIGYSFDSIPDGVVYVKLDLKNNVVHLLDKDGNALAMCKDNKTYTLRATGYDVKDTNPQS